MNKPWQTRLDGDVERLKLVVYIKIDECEVEGTTDSEGEERRDADASTEAAQ